MRLHELDFLDTINFNSFFRVVINILKKKVQNHISFLEIVICRMIETAEKFHQIQNLCYLLLFHETMTSLDTY